MLALAGGRRIGSARDSDGSAEIYARAYSAHYAEHDLSKALALYRDILRGFGAAREAEYARAQIRNIAHAIVPEADLLEAQIQLAISRLENGES